MMRVRNDDEQQHRDVLLLWQVVLLCDSEKDIIATLERYYDMYSYYLRVVVKIEDQRMIV